MGAKNENAYADAVMAPLKGFEEKLYKELIGHIKQDDSSVPYRYKDYWYYTRFEQGKEYPIHARRKDNMNAPEEALLDVNQLAAGKSFYQVANWRVSPGQDKLAYLEDTVGRRQFSLRIKNLTTGETYADEVKGLSASVVWSDNRTVFYVENDPATLLIQRRPPRRALGDPNKLECDQLQIDADSGRAFGPAVDVDGSDSA